MSSEVETGLFVGEPAWHGIGTVVSEAPSLKDAIKLAGLDWKVKLVELQTKEETPRDVSHRVTVRESDDSILGVVGPAFEPLQNADAFEWFQPFVDSGVAQIEAAGSLREGRRIWVLATVKGGELDVVKGDALVLRILLAHAHDHSLAIRAGFTHERVVCANTLRGALETDKSAKRLVRITHRKGAKDALNLAREVMDLAINEFKASAEDYRALAGMPCDEAKLKRYIREVFAPGQADDEKAVPVTLKKIVPLFEGGRGAEFSRGTMWGAYNAITEYLTHMRGKTVDARVENAWFGYSAQLAQRALKVALTF